MPGQLLGVPRPRKIWRNGWRNSQKRPGEPVLALGIDEPLATKYRQSVRTEKIAQSSRGRGKINGIAVGRNEPARRIAVGLGA